MATAVLYTTSKRHNSTLVPSSGTSVDVQLKDGCDLLNPVFLYYSASLPSYSCMSFEGRYYFITDIVSVRQDLWELHAAVDVLATYKSNILAKNQHVLYANAGNAEIIDNRLAVETSATYSTNYVTLAASLMTGQWKIAVSVVGDDSTTTYLLTPAQVKALVNATDFDSWFNSLWASIQSEQSNISSTQSSYTSSAQSIANQAQTITSTTDGLSLIGQATALAAQCGARIIGDVIQSSINALAKFFRKIIATPSASDCIRAATFIPWDVVGDGSQQEIMLGELATGVYALPVYNPIQTGSVSIAIPWQASDWRRNAPYHQFYLYLPFVGDIQLSPASMIDETSLTIYYSLNVVNGALNYRVAGASHDGTIGCFSAQTGCPYAIGASNITPVDAGSSIIGGLAAAAAAGATGGAALGAAGIAAASLNNMHPNVSCVGGGSGGAASGLDMRVILHSVFHDTNTTPSAVRASIGEPLNDTVSMANFTGFVQTQQASVTGSMTDTERTMINNMLDGGIFIE